MAAGENDDDEIKILRPTEGAAAIPLAAVRIDLFQHLTFNHDKTVGKLIVLQDIRHQSPLILSGAPRRMNTNCLSRQLPHPLLPPLFLPSLFPLLIFGPSSDSSVAPLFPCLSSLIPSSHCRSYLLLKTVNKADVVPRLSLFSFEREKNNHMIGSRKLRRLTDSFSLPSRWAKTRDLKKEEMIRKHAGDRLSSSWNGFLSYPRLFYIFHRYDFSQITLH